MSKPYTIFALNQTIQLSERPFATGGEGALYHVVAPVAWQGQVVKLLHERKRTPERQAKAAYLAAHPPPVPPSASATIVWGQHLLHDASGHFVGWIMPHASGEQLEWLTTPKLPRQATTDWADWKRGTPLSKAKRLALGHRIAAIVHALHQTGRYCLADLKPDNLLVQPSGVVALVDTDSMAVLEQGNPLFGTVVATPEYSPPEYHQQGTAAQLSPAWDHFSLAVILYRLLLGVHPFAASTAAPYDHCVTLADKIQAGLFVQAPVPLVQWVSRPPLHDGFEALPLVLKRLFVRAFQTGHAQPSARPTALEWATALAQSHEGNAWHVLPSVQLKEGLLTPAQGYAWVIQQVVAQVQPVPTITSWRQLPSASTVQNTLEAYRQTGHFFWRNLRKIGWVLVLLLGLLWLGLGLENSDWGMGHVIGKTVAWGDGVQQASIKMLGLALLLPFFWTVVKEQWSSVEAAWRQQLGHPIEWQHLNRYTLHKLRRWRNRLFKQRRKLRHQVRRLEQEQAVYKKAKQQHEQRFAQQYQWPLQQLAAELEDHHQAWQQALEAYDARALQLIQEERAALGTQQVEALAATPDAFPTLRQHTAPTQLRQQYNNQHRALLAEAQQTLHTHQQAIHAHLQAWSQTHQLPTQLLGTHYRSVLSELVALDEQLNHQKIALHQLNGQLQAVRQALK